MGLHRLLLRKVFVTLALGVFIAGAVSFPSIAAEIEDPTAAPVDNAPLADYLPFSPGEELTYQLLWWGIPAGQAVMRVDESTEHNGHLVWRLTSTATSSKFLDVIYKVRDQAESLFDPTLRAPRYYNIDQHEGRYQARRTITFDQEAGKSTYVKNDNPPKIESVPSGAQDPLSCLYYLRSLNLEPGTTVTIPTFPGKELHMVKVDVLRRETVRLPLLGTVDTLVIQPHLDFTGIFRKTGNVFIWITDDDRKIPVRMKTAIIFGSVWADLLKGRGCRKAPKMPEEKGLPPGEVCIE